MQHQAALSFSLLFMLALVASIILGQLEKADLAVR